MNDVLDAITGPLATLAAAGYLRAALIKHSATYDRSDVAGALICFGVICYLALFRALVTLDVMTFESSIRWTRPFSPLQYGVHIYVAYRLTFHARARAAGAT